MELSHTLTAVVMSEVDSPQLTENAVYGGFWADCGVRRPCTACELIVGKRGALLNSYPRALAGYLCRLVCWSYSLCSLAERQTDQKTTASPAVSKAFDFGFSLASKHSILVFARQ